MKTILDSRNQEKAEIILQYDRPGNTHHEHPFGNVLMTKASAEWLELFLLSQSFIEKVTITDHTTPIDSDTFDLNIFRKLPIDFRSMYIPRWYYYVIPSLIRNLDFNHPWITLNNKDSRTNGKILLFRTQRYQNKFVDYSFLSDHKDDCVFIGTETEFTLFRKMVDCQYIKVQDAMEAANLIGSADLTIGNQTFFYSIAESAKTDRLCELSNYCPNTYAHGGYCNDILYTQQFEAIMNKYFEKKGK